MAEHVRTPEELANNLAFFQIDLSDPDFHGLALEYSRRVRAGYRALFGEAIGRGSWTRAIPPRWRARCRLSPPAPCSTGRSIGTARSRLGAADLETLITPYVGADDPEIVRAVSA